MELYRDALMLVLNKPAGLAVHPEPGARGPHLRDLLESLKAGRPEVAHRLDRDTTGCLVLGRHAKALRRLHSLFSEGQVEKVYWALCGGDLPAEGEIDLPLSEKGKDGRVRVDPSGKPALTRFRRLEGALVELRPITGRTHQLRAHLAALGAPILGDKRYGGAAAKGMALHSRSVRLPLYPRRDPIYVEAPVPEWWNLCSS